MSRGAEGVPGWAARRIEVARARGFLSAREGQGMETTMSADFVVRAVGGDAADAAIAAAETAACPDGRAGFPAQRAVRR